MASTFLALKKHPDFESHSCVTAHYREMLEQVLGIFGITPYVDWKIMQPDQTLAGYAARAVQGLDVYVKLYRPDMVLVQGDTTTVLAGSLGSFYNRILVGHVEPGLRTGKSIFPMAGGKEPVC